MTKLTRNALIQELFEYGIVDVAKVMDLLYCYGLLNDEGERFLRSLEVEFLGEDDMAPQDELMAITKSYGYCVGTWKELMENSVDEINNIKVRDVILAFKDLKKVREHGLM